MKKVSYREYCKAISDFKKNIRENIDIYDMGGFLDKPIRIGINWASIGTVSPEEAERFAVEIKKAAALAKEFPYNGYMIDF